MFKSVDELNKEFYALYGDFVENKDSMPAEQRDVMSKTLLKRYKRAYKLLEMREELELAREEYELNLRMDQFIPRTWRFLFFRRRYNRAAELSGAIIAEEVERYFRDKEDALAQREGRAMLPDGTVQSVLRWYAATRGKDALLPLWAPGEADAEDEPQEEAEEVQEAEEDAEKGGDAGAADVV